MSAVDASELLRPCLLEGVSILLAGASSGPVGPGSFGDAVLSACAGLGARVCELSLDATGQHEEAAIEETAQEAVEHALADGRTIELLAVDCASVFARACAGASIPRCRAST